MDNEPEETTSETNERRLETLLSIVRTKETMRVMKDKVSELEAIISMGITQLEKEFGMSDDDIIKLI